MNATERRFPTRKRLAHPPVLTGGNRSVIVFLTVCSRDRRPVLACDDAHHSLRMAWTQAAWWSVGRYVVMPDHVHMFCAPSTYPPEPLRNWVRYWKSLVSKSWPRQAERPLWQADAWDTQLRRGESYEAKWLYVRENPVRAGCVSQPADWPYQGEIHVLPWHD